MQNALAPWRTAFVAATTISVANVVVLGVGQLSGADMRVAQTAGAAATQVGVGMVLLMSVGPTIPGGLALWLAARRSARAWRGVGWAGLALGVLTVPLPYTVQASSDTSLTLAVMHLVGGLVWFGAVRRAGARRNERSASHSEPGPEDPTTSVAEGGGRPAKGERA